MTEEHPIATEVVFEDDTVRVWNQLVPSGDSIPFHRHEHDYFLLNISGTGPIAVQFHDDSGGSLGDAFEFMPVPGKADYVRKGHVETATNLGDTYRAILVELKKT